MTTPTAVADLRVLFTARLLRMFACGKLAVVPPAEGAAANGVTSTAKQLGTALGPLIAGRLFSAAAASALPFFVCGILKISYDLMLWRAFRKTKPPEEA